MAFSFKHYAFAATALVGVYSAQISVGFIGHDHAERTIAQVAVQVELTSENVMEQIAKQNESILERISKAEEQLQQAQEISKVSELKDLKAKHKKHLSESLESYDLFQKNVDNFLATQVAEFDRTAIDEAMANLSQAQLNLSSSFNQSKIEEFIVAARDNEAAARDEKMGTLQAMLCQQKESLSALKEELSDKLAELTKLISSSSDQGVAARGEDIYSPNFQMPWTQMSSPFAAMMNPFSFLSGGMNNFMGMQDMGQMDFGRGLGFTQNNFYGPTSFNTYSMMMPKMPQQRQRGPSQQVVKPEHVPPANVVIPSAQRVSIPEVSMGF